MAESLLQRTSTCVVVCTVWEGGTYHDLKWSSLSESAAVPEEVVPAPIPERRRGRRVRARTNLPTTADQRREVCKP